MSNAIVSDIIAASQQPEIDVVRVLWREYWDAMNLSSGFQNFEEEMNSLPGLYVGPRGRILLARIDGNAAGAAAFRPLSDIACEAKRLYVRPQFRGLGLGKALLTRLMQEARSEGYSEMKGDTLKFMTSALQLYKDFGFAEVGPYSPRPTPDAVYLKLDL